jgi:O-antigen/teichoic acid export membrane protein
LLDFLTMTSSVISRVAGLAALTAAGQLLIIGSLPAYSNIFDPGTYGEYVIFVGAYTVISALAGVSYDSAIVLPRNHGIAAALTALAMLIAVSVSVLIALATLLSAAFSWTPGRWVPAEHHFGYGLAAATTVGALQRCSSAWCVRDNRFLTMGWGQLIFCLVTIIAQLSFAEIMHHGPALIWGYVCALGCQTTWLAAPILAARRPTSAPAHLLRAMGIVARKYRRFPIYMVGYGLASSARDRLIQVVLGIGAGAAAVGRFGLAYRVAFAPNSLVYTAVSPIFYSIASRGSRSSVGRFAARAVEAMFVLLVVPYVGFAIEAPAIADVVLSTRWHGTGPYLQALAGPALVLGATCWLDRAFDSFGKQRTAFSLEASFTIISVILVGGLSRFAGPLLVSWAFGLLALIYYWTYFLMTFVACGFPMAEFRRANRNGLIVICIVAACAVAIHLAPWLTARLTLYAMTMAAVIAVWFRHLDGAATVYALARARVGRGGTQSDG